MKKTLLTAAMASFILFGATQAFAAVGDVAGTIYTTDILTQVDGRDIQSYSIDGETLIALEDLEPYGFRVYYNDNIRTVFITKNGEPSQGFLPEIKRGRVGGIAGNYYETDITAVVNGEPVQAYAIGGKMAAKVEDLGDTGRLSAIGRYPYQMIFSYYDSQRLLSLKTSVSQFGTTDDAKKVILDYRLWHPFHCRILHSGEKLLVERFYGGSPHGGTVRNYYVSLDNGLIYSAYSVARKYEIYMSEPVFSADGKYLYFKNSDLEGNFRDYKQLELDSLHVMPLDKADYDSAAGIIEKSGYTLSLNGEELGLYSIGSEDYAKAEELRENGYTPSAEEIRVFDSVEYVPLSGWAYDFGDSGTYLNAKCKYNYNPYTKTVTASPVK